MNYLYKKLLLRFKHSLCYKSKGFQGTRGWTSTGSAAFLNDSLLLVPNKFNHITLVCVKDTLFWSYTIKTTKDTSEIAKRSHSIIVNRKNNSILSCHAISTLVYYDFNDYLDNPETGDIIHKVYASEFNQLNFSITLNNIGSRLATFSLNPTEIDLKNFSFRDIPMSSSQEVKPNYLDNDGIITIGLDSNEIYYSNNGIIDTIIKFNSKILALAKNHKKNEIFFILKDNNFDKYLAGFKAIHEACVDFNLNSFFNFNSKS